MTLCLLMLTPVQSLEGVNRLNYGLMFEHITEQKPVTAIWQHAFKISLPKHEFGNEFTYGNVAPSLSAREIKNMETWIGCLEASEKNFAHVAKAGTLCGKFSRNVRFLVKIARHSHLYLQELVNDTRALLPVELKRSSGANKRSLFDFVSSAAKSLFGFATQNDLINLAKQVQGLQNMGHTEVESIKKQSEHLTSFVSASSERIENLVQTIKRVAIDQVKAFELVLKDVDFQTSYLANITIHALVFEHASTMLAR